MLDSVTERNLFLCDKVFLNLKTLFDSSLRDDRGFLSVYYGLKNARPYINNLALFCNLYFDKNIKPIRSDNYDLFASGKEYKKTIGEIDKVISQHYTGKKFQIDFSSDSDMEILGNLLSEIDQQPKSLGLINRYFMGGMIEAAVAVEKERRKILKMGLEDHIEEAELADQIMSVLSGYGVRVTEDNTDSVYELLCQTGNEFLVEKNMPRTADVNKSIVKQLHRTFKIQESLLEPYFEKQSEQMCNLIAQTRKYINRPKQALYNLCLFAGNLKVVPHDDVEKLIYVSKLSRPIVMHNYRLVSNQDIPDYLMPYENNPDFKAVQKQMPHWEEYEKNSRRFDRDDVYGQCGVIAWYWLRNLYEDIGYYCEQADKLCQQKDDDEEDDDNDKKYKISAVSRKDEEDFALFAENLIKASHYVEKYTDCVINRSGIEEKTVEMMLCQEHLSVDDVKVLWDMINVIGDDLDDKNEIFKSIGIPDWHGTAKLIQSMPHGKDRQEALECLNGCLNVVFQESYDDMESRLFDIDCLIGQKYPENDEMLFDFIKNGANTYPDLQNENLAEVSDAIHMGVLAAYLAPLYQAVEFNDAQKNVAVCFIDNYTGFAPETQKFLFNLTQYYAEKLINKYSAEQDIQECPEELNEALIAYDDAQDVLEDIADTQEEVEEELMAERKISVEYHKYKTQKEMFELPENFDLMLATCISNAVSR